MKNIKNLLIILSLLTIGVINVLIYMNINILNHALENVGNLESRIETLENANNFFPINARVYRELGRAHFLIAEGNLGDSELRDYHFQRSLSNFTLSARLNPGAYQTHFYFGQALFHMNYFMDLDVNYLEEFKKSTELTYSDRSVYFDVGLILLSQWPELSEENREYTIKILREFTSYRDPRKLESILQTWAVMVGDYDVINSILPQDSIVYRRIAEFFGAKSLSLEERHSKLAQAEYLEFLGALDSFKSAQDSLRLRRITTAFKQFKSTLKTLDRIKLYQNLDGQILIDPQRYGILYRSAQLGIIQSLANTKDRFSELKFYLCEFLDQENEMDVIWDLEKYLVKKNVIPEASDIQHREISQIFCRINLDYVQYRYREVTKYEDQLKTSLYQVTDENRADFVHLYRIIGESFQKLDFLYDANEFFQMAYQLDPTDIETLDRMIFNYQRLNDTEKLNAVEQEIQELITSKNQVLSNRLIQKDQEYAVRLKLLDEKIRLTFSIRSQNPSLNPLVSVIYERKVIWEGFLETEELTLDLDSSLGENIITIIPVNGPIYLEGISYSPSQ
ncbi:hypothetical protein ACFLT9_07820 [Acidobacteriota bacterium]